jgi:hypothetical protein
VDLTNILDPKYLDLIVSKSKVRGLGG